MRNPLALLHRLRIAFQATRHTLRSLRRVGLSPWRALTIFDVGANDGYSFLPAALVFRWWRVFAFEPTPRLIAMLHYRVRGRRGYQIVPKAIGEEEGTARFNVAGHNDWGCSSLLEFSENRRATWPGRTDLDVTERIEVEVMRLDRFVRESGVERIDFLHVDTQGTDLAVLRSLGAELARVQAGVIEVPMSEEVRLYQAQHTKAEALAFLEAHGFAVCAIVPQPNEENVFFRRA